MAARAYNLVVQMGQSDGLFPGIAALYNTQVGSVVQVRRVEILPPGGQTALGVGRMGLQRFLTAYPSADEPPYTSMPTSWLFQSAPSMSPWAKMRRPRPEGEISV